MPPKRDQCWAPAASGHAAAAPPSSASSVNAEWLAGYGARARPLRKEACSIPLFTAGEPQYSSDSMVVCPSGIGASRKWFCNRSIIARTGDTASPARKCHEGCYPTIQRSQTANGHSTGAMTADKEGATERHRGRNQRHASSQAPAA